jgi:TetR/AcrR family transcriptional repressor of nem operon
MIKSKKTRRYIIEKTSKIFNKKGYAGTSLTDLTSATKLTKGSIYGNFKNKEEVAEAAFNFNYQSLIKRFTPNLSAARTAKEKLHAFLNTYEALFDSLIDAGGCPILNNAVDADDTNEKMKQLSVKAIADWEKNLVSLIKLGMEQKEIDSSIDAQFYTDLFITAIEGSLMVSKVTGEKRYFTHVIKHLKTMVDDVF